jgi:hypothetical protein
MRPDYKFVFFNYYVHFLLQKYILEIFMYILFSFFFEVSICQKLEIENNE